MRSVRSLHHCAFLSCRGRRRRSGALLLFSLPSSRRAPHLVPGKRLRQDRERIYWRASPRLLSEDPAAPSPETQHFMKCCIDPAADIEIRLPWRCCVSGCCGERGTVGRLSDLSSFARGGGSRMQAGAPESVPAVPLLSSPREGSGALHKTHCGRLRLFPGTPGSPFLSGLWKRSWDGAVILTMMRILTDGPYFRACGRSWVPSETEELRALHSPDS